MQFFPQELSAMFIFLVSAVAHEYVISVAMMRFSYWSFLAMFAQFFSIVIEKYMLKVGSW